MQSVTDVLSMLPEITRGKLISFYGSQDAVEKYFKKRYGNYAPDIITAIVKKKDNLGPMDPIIGVNVATGEIYFNHLEEFYHIPWSKSIPRVGSHIDALKLGGVDD